MCTCLENVLKNIGFRWLKIIVLNFQNKIDLTSLLPLLLNLVRTLLQFQMVRGISLTEFGWVNGVLQKNVFKKTYVSGHYTILGIWSVRFLLTIHLNKLYFWWTIYYFKKTLSLKLMKSVMIAHYSVVIYWLSVSLTSTSFLSFNARWVRWVWLPTSPTILTDGSLDDLVPTPVPALTYTTAMSHLPSSSVRDHMKWVCFENTKMV